MTQEPSRLHGSTRRSWSWCSFHSPSVRVGIASSRPPLDRMRFNRIPCTNLHGRHDLIACDLFAHDLYTSLTGALCPKDTPMTDDLAKQIKLDVLLCFAAYSASHAFNRLYR